MPRSEEVRSLVPLIEAHFSVSKDELSLQEPKLQDIEKKLAQIISILLNKDLEKLLSIFYRIDLDEHTFKKILHQEAPENISTRLAQEVIKRELEKVRTRQKYKDY